MRGEPGVGRRRRRVRRGALPDAADYGETRTPTRSRTSRRGRRLNLPVPSDRPGCICRCAALRTERRRLLTGPGRQGRADRRPPWSLGAIVSAPLDVSRRFRPEVGAPGMCEWQRSSANAERRRGADDHGEEHLRRGSGSSHVGGRRAAVAAHVPASPRRSSPSSAGGERGPEASKPSASHSTAFDGCPGRFGAPRPARLLRATAGTPYPTKLHDAGVVCAVGKITTCRRPCIEPRASGGDERARPSESRLVEELDAGWSSRTWQPTRPTASQGPRGPSPRPARDRRRRRRF